MCWHPRDAGGDQMLILGLVGYAGAGKDTIADYLVATYGFKKYAIAEPIKRLLDKRFGWTPEMWEDREWKERKPLWGGPSPRELAQWLGTDVGRETFGQTCWTDLLRKKILAQLPARAVITDMRFESEAQDFKDEFCYDEDNVAVAYVHNPSIPLRHNHPSETAVREEWCDYVIDNEPGDLRVTFDRVDILMKELGVSRYQ